MDPDSNELSAWVSLWLHTRILVRVGGREIEVDSASDLVRSLAPASLPLAVITAYNPMGLSHEQAENEAANVALRERLRELGFHPLPAVGRAVTGDWEEPGFAVSDLGQDDALALAREFGQLALFWVETDTVSALAADGAGRWSRPRGQFDVV